MAPLACMRVRMTSRGCTAADTRAPEMTPDSADAVLLFPFLFLLPPFCCCCCVDRCDSGCAAWAEAAAPMPAQLAGSDCGLQVAVAAAAAAVAPAGCFVVSDVQL